MKTFFTLGRLVCLALMAIFLVDPALIDDLMFRHFLRTAILVWIAVEIAQLFSSCIVHNQRLGSRMRNISAGIFAFVVCLVFLEILWTFIPRSHGVGYTYAARNFRHYYFHANELGYRDKPVSQIDPQKYRIIVLGDSFAAGHGLRSPEDAFPGQLRRHLGNEIEVLNLGLNGSDTRDEYERLLQYPLQPDLLILQYFGNDIEIAAADSGVDIDNGFRPYQDVNALAETVLRSSYLANYAYWLYPHGDVNSYVDSLFSAFGNADALDSHLSDLGKIFSYSSERDIPLVVVVFPFLMDLKRSEPVVEPVRNFFEEQGIPVIDVANLVHNVPVRSRVVNSNDGHPSVLVHRLVADSLAEVVARENWLQID